MISDKKIYWTVTTLSLCVLWLIIPFFFYNYLEYKQEKENINTSVYVTDTSKVDFDLYRNSYAENLTFIDKATLKNKIWKMESNAFNIRNYLQVEYREQNSNEIKELLNNYNKYWDFMFEVKNNFNKGIFVKKASLLKISEIYDIKNVSALQKYQPALNSEIYASVILYYVLVLIVSIMWFSKKYRNIIKSNILYYYSK